MKNTNPPWTWTDGEALKGPDNALIMGILRTPFEKDANRRLIAAAPELLEACRAVVRQLESDTYPNCTAIQMAKAAIAKAEGLK